MRNDIKFFGLGRNWTLHSAQVECAKIKEMGFYVRLIQVAENNYVIAHSYKGFSLEDAVKALENLPNLPQN
jgi:hypothetical protein